jgi:peptidyl-Asp metalloendopeptidase
MKRLIIHSLALLASASILASAASAENLFAPLNKVYDVDARSSAYGIRRQGKGNMNTNLLTRIFNSGSGDVSQVPLQMLDGSKSTLQLRRQQSNNVGGIQIVSGIVDGKSHNMATLANNNGELRGRIWKDGQLFRLNGERNGEYRLSEINIARMSNSNDTIAPGARDVQQGQSQLRQSQQRLSGQDSLPPEDEPIDLLLFVTTKAIKDLGGDKKANSEMELMVAEANNIYRLSGVTKGQMFRLVGIVPLPWKENNDASIDLVEWRSAKPILSIRNKSGADLVAFITSPEDYGGLCGMGFIGPDVDNTEAFPELGYSISVLPCILTNLVFPHEIGHNMGAWHDRHVDPRKGNNHGHINLEKKWRTVMAYPAHCWKTLKEDCPSVPYFSNPRMTYKEDRLGVEPGQENSADNVTAIRRNKRVVASYRPRADAKASSKGKPSGQATSTTSASRNIGGINLEPASQSQKAVKSRNGKERKIKW